jgi:polysaccharide export outer membrane protein
MIQLKTLSNSLIVLSVSLFLSSCGASKDVLYFQGVENQINTTPNELNVTIQPNDNLMIVVTTASSNPELAVPYNSIDLNRGYTSNVELQGYLVDDKGNIVFPSLGSLHVAGMTKNQVSQMIQQKLLQSIEKPEVSIRLINYKVSVLGEVNRPGTFSVSNEQISLPEALSLAGDMTIYGQRNDILVCRIENNAKKFYHVNIASPDVFNSEAYYLQQNDVVYVKPNKARTSAANVSPVLGTYLSAASLLIGITTLVINIVK